MFQQHLAADGDVQFPTAEKNDNDHSDSDYKISYTSHNNTHNQTMQYHTHHTITRTQSGNTLHTNHSVQHHTITQHTQSDSTTSHTNHTIHHTLPPCTVSHS